MTHTEQLTRCLAPILILSPMLQPLAAAQGIDLPDHLALAQASDGGIAAHPAERPGIQGDELAGNTEAGGGDGRLDDPVVEVEWLGLESMSILLEHVDMGDRIDVPTTTELHDHVGVGLPDGAKAPTVHLTLDDANTIHLGDRLNSNVRTIYQYIHPGGAQSCQLVMGMTLLEPGSMWNTMPAHTHARRDRDACHRGP